MEESHLSKMLEQLRHELKNAQTIDDRARELLAGLREDIEKLYDSAGEEVSEAYEPFRRRLEDSMQHFEVSHPTLTEVMSRTIDAMNRAGL